MNRTKTGIEGLDKALNGGFPEKNVVLVSGGAGTGKSTFCMQFLINGALQFDEKGLYISTEQTREELQRMASSFGWELNKLEESGLLKIIYYDFTDGDNFLGKVDLVVKEFNPKRIVVDSMTTLTDSLLVSDLSEDTAFSMVQVAESVSPVPRTEQIIAKSILFKLIKSLKQYKVTTLLTSELLEGHEGLSADQVSEFICDGVVTLHSLGIAGSESKVLNIVKMRYTSHEKSNFPYEIEDIGIRLNYENKMDVLMK